MELLLLLAAAVVVVVVQEMKTEAGGKAFALSPSEDCAASLSCSKAGSSRLLGCYSRQTSSRVDWDASSRLPLWARLELV